MTIRIWGLALCALWTAACGTLPIPNRAVEGSTITVLIPNGFDVGYGRAWARDPGNPWPSYELDPDPGSPGNENAESWPVEDLQRGEMILTLVDPDTGSDVAKLPIRYITRAAMDQASLSAAGGLAFDGQTIAVVDLPLGLVDDPDPAIDFEQIPAEEIEEALAGEGDLDVGIKAYGIRVQRFRREPPTNDFVEVVQSYPFNPPPGGGTWEWLGWGASDSHDPDELIPIRVLDAPGPAGLETTDYTPKKGWGPQASPAKVRTQIFFDNPGTGLMDQAVPRPEFRVRLPSSVSAPPFAWELDVTYPAERVEILNVRLLRGNQSGAYVAWSASPATPPTSCSNPSLLATTTVRVVDPEPDDQQRARGVAVVFRLANQGDEDCQQRVAAGEIGVEAIRAYDVDGVLFATPPAFDLVATDLH